MAEPLILRFGERGPEELARRSRSSGSCSPALVDEEAIKRIFKSDRQTAAQCALAEANARQGAERHRSAFVFGAEQTAT
jgi:hypothetical protein